ncbi:ATP-dependent DNA helicase [Salix suchowensis]|nr:ATP-dependent DNA helicase [Salix suchowensis]
MGAQIDNTINSQPGPYIFKINGQCHHLMGSLLPIDAESPRFAQLYIFDTDNEITNRLHPFNNDSCQSSLDENVVKKLIDMLDSSNALVKLFRQVRHRLNNDEFPNFKLCVIVKRDGDSKQYDDPSSNDVCGLIVGDIGESQTDRDIIIENIINASLSSSPLWPKFEIMLLKQNMRLSIDGLGSDEINEIKAFAKWILKIGNGDLCDIPFFDELDESLIKIPCDLQLHTSGDPIKAMVSAIYPGIEQPALEPSYFKERAIVTPKNITVTEINNFILGVTHGPQRIYRSSDSIDASSSDDDNMNLLYPLEFINQLEFSGVPSHILALKIGAPIMLLRNLSPMIGLCNGTRLITTQLADRVIEAQIMTGSHIGDRVFIPRIVFPIIDDKCPFTIKRRQFPIRLCYAMTINKSQGQSLKFVGVFLKEQVFTHGQLYVALSRVTSKKGLKIISCDQEGKQLDYAKNIVYKDVLNSLPKGLLPIQNDFFFLSF